MIKKNPLVFEINANQFALRVKSSKAAKTTLNDVTDATLKRWKSLGFDAIWIMGVWTRGNKSREVSRTDESFTCHYAEDLPDWSEEDVVGSPYAIMDYRVAPEFGGNEALIALRARMKKMGLSLILDFVPNHTAPDHPWVKSNPNYYVQGSDEQAQSEPQNYTRDGDHVFAYGRDPYFSGWKDTYQLDYRRSEVQQAMIRTLRSISELCDGVRCDMAMLVLNDIFHRTWGKLPDEKATSQGYEEFWAEAIDSVRAKHPQFVFMAEAYWGLEGRLQMLGFDYTYNKAVYDDLVHQQYRAIRGYIQNEDYSRRSVFFIENHDEPRAAAALSDQEYRHVAAFLTTTLPGVRLLHDGQMEGRKVRHSVHLGRRLDEPTNNDEVEFYESLLKVLKKSCIGKGEWQVLDTQAVRDGNESHLNLLAYLWTSENGSRDLVLINFTGYEEEGFVQVRSPLIDGRSWKLKDRLSSEEYIRSGSEMSERGLYVRLSPFATQIFELTLG